jgi:ribokinase
VNIIVVGDINADLNMSLEALPREGDDQLVTGLRWSSGGAGLNSATAFAQVGARVKLVGRVGRDAAAEAALHPARQAGVDLTHLQHDPERATGLCSVLVTPGGQRTLMSYRGANVNCDPAQIGPELLEGCALLSLCGHALLENPQRAAVIRALDLATERGIPVALDLCLPTIREAGELLVDLVPRLWLLTMNEDELHTWLPGLSMAQAIAQLQGYGLQHLAIKRGPQGCRVVDGSQQLDCLPPTVTAIDTTGCGDAFSAGYAWALLRGTPLLARATLANLIGALTATRRGAAEALPTRAELAAQLDLPLRDLLIA